jgi:transmembrane sensor
MSDEMMDRKIARYVAGQSSDDEIREVRAWMHDDPDRRAHVESLQRVWKATTEGIASRWDAAAAWERVTRRIAARPTLVPHDAAPPARRGRPSLSRYRQATPMWGRFAMAAGILIGAALGGVAIWQSHVSKPATVAAAPLRDVATRRGQQADVYLSDGTHVVLGVASRLRFPGTFGVTRDVYLDGEAYFEVAHDVASPFTVHTARGVVKDLGTKFNVRAYTDGSDRSVEVVVAQGVVALEPRAPTAAHVPRASAAASGAPVASTIVLRASDLGRIDANGDLSTRHGVDVVSYLAWTRGELVFKNLPMRDVLSTLTRWYDADLRVGDSTLAAYPVTATLTGERLADVVNLLANALDARVEHQGHTIIFRRRHERPVNAVGRQDRVWQS